jgi:hypothetical protein
LKEAFNMRVEVGDSDNSIDEGDSANLSSRAEGDSRGSVDASEQEQSHERAETKRQGQDAEGKPEGKGKLDGTKGDPDCNLRKRSSFERTRASYDEVELSSLLATIPKMNVSDFNEVYYENSGELATSRSLESCKDWLMTKLTSELASFKGCIAPVVGARRTKKPKK